MSEDWEGEAEAGGSGGRADGRTAYIGDSITDLLAMLSGKRRGQGPHRGVPPSLRNSQWALEGLSHVRGGGGLTLVRVSYPRAREKDDHGPNARPRGLRERNKERGPCLREDVEKTPEVPGTGRGSDARCPMRSTARHMHTVGVREAGSLHMRTVRLR